MSGVVLRLAIHPPQVHPPQGATQFFSEVYTETFARS